jgi:hypothetical protein
MLSFLVMIALVAGQANPTPIAFTKDAVGKLPAGWKAAQTGEGQGSVWTVVADDTAPSKSKKALAQTAKGPTRLFNICILEDSKFLSGDLSVKLKSVAGEVDQGGGLVWRYQDANNYYIARYNPLEANFRVYKVAEGKRTQLATQENLELAAGKWDELAIRQDGDRIQCFLNGKPYLDVRDNTFTKPGKVGLWTKADAQTRFDELLIQGK